jgi:hypothetical protein
VLSAIRSAGRDESAAVARPSCCVVPSTFAWWPAQREKNDASSLVAFSVSMFERPETAVAVSLPLSWASSRLPSFCRRAFRRRKSTLIAAKKTAMNVSCQS